ncbi:MAG: hypothetical protein OCC49_00630 [Fibrobacterales bacterium]
MMEMDKCKECGSSFYHMSDSAEHICAECAHVLYGYKNCSHIFREGHCVLCFWDKSESEYVRHLKGNH